MKKKRLNSAKEDVDKAREEAKRTKQRADEMKTSVANSAKELQGYDTQQKITMQALDREST